MDLIQFYLQKKIYENFIESNKFWLSEISFLIESTKYSDLHKSTKQFIKSSKYFLVHITTKFFGWSDENFVDPTKTFIFQPQFVWFNQIFMDKNLLGPFLKK